MKQGKLLKSICLFFILLGILQLLTNGIQYFAHKREQKNLSELFEQAQEKQNGGQELRSNGQEKRYEEQKLQDSKQEAQDANVMLSQFEKLYEQNSDIVGWLSIEGTKINYPVMQSEDDEYYLHRSFQKEEDKYGSLYVRQRADVFTPETNFIIYGHNMRDGSMFGELDRFIEESFWKEHPMISFDTLYEERTYEIVSVFLSQVYKEDEDAFKYYQFYEADTEEEFNYFYQNIKKLALYDTGVEAEYGNTFLTLSTCAYHVEDGRLVVVAKKLDKKFK